ncbi:MAG: cation diffusion facilitator family transporter [Acutalibacteraceae bacterium]|nr:cation diffusion facilitator family transporter [Acutalibacteraceae bacterium]
MKTQRNILIAFILNLSFSVFEFIGGTFCGSVAIVSDAVHDLGDALSIGIAYFLERKSKKAPDDTYTYGYTRYSVIGGVITTSILIFGSLAVMYNAVLRIISPVEINYNGMLIFAVVGASVNFLAAFFTREGDSVNQKAVNLHMLEDVLGWVVVLAGAFIMRFTDIRIIDPLMSMGVAVFILVNAVRTLKKAVDLFLEKTPDGISVSEIKEHLCRIDGVTDVHHIHIWSMDGVNNYATVHVVTNEEPHKIKHLVREEMAEHGIAHITVEIETGDEHCHEKSCSVKHIAETGHHHHHHHH